MQESRARQRFIVFPSPPSRLATEFVGGKAATLLLLKQKGFSVPPFFVLTTAAYFEQLGTPRLRQALERWRSAASQERRQELAAEIGGLLQTAPLPQSCLTELRDAVDRLGPTEPVAVRSSATVEDLGEGSFAGIFASRLGVVGVSEIEDAVREVWASLWSPPALIYFRRVGRDPSAAAMAVIVQRLVSAQAAGVAFGVTSQNEPVRIECVSGLGVPLVSGRASPERYMVDVVNGRLLDRGPVADDQSAADGSKGKPEQTGSPALLDDRIALRVANQVVKVGRALGFPADVEWVLDGNEYVHLVQARPITARVQPTRAKRIWTGYFFLERFPTPVSPLGWDLLRGAIEQRAFGDSLLLLGYPDLAGQQLTRLFWGRPYTDLRVFRALYGWIPVRHLSQDKRDLLDGGIRFGLFRLFAFALRCLQDPNAIVPVHLWLWRRFLPRYTVSVDKLGAEDLTAFTSEQLMDRLDQVLQLTDDFLKLHRWSLTYADLFFQIIRWSAWKWAGLSAVLAAKLVEDPSGDRTAVMNAELTELGQQATRNPQTWERLKKGDFDASEVSQKLSDFLRRYGHRSTSLDPAVPTWGDDPGYVLEMIGRLRGRVEPRGDAASVGQAVPTPGALEKEFLSRFNPVWRPLWRGLLRTAQTFVRLREDERFYWQMAIAQLRRVCLEAGRRLVQNKVLAEAADVFYLRRHELARLLYEPRDSRKLISQRKRQCLEDAQVLPAQRLLELEDGRIVPDARPIEGRQLVGLAISPGRARGRARIVADMASFQRLQPGDILVTRSLDPGWTPVLGIVSAVVLEVGGMLSHGSILAREFGVPGVSNIPGLLDRLRDGDILFVDGDRGEVVVGGPGSGEGETRESMAERIVSDLRA